MRLGLYYDLRNPGAARPWARVYGAALDRIAWADDAGIGAIWVTEHHGFADGYLPAPLTFCAAIAARTRRARIGTAVVVSPLMPATALAEQAAVVDILSDGRLELGLGAGWRAAEFPAFGADYARRYEALEDADPRAARAVGQRAGDARPGAAAAAGLGRGARPARRPAGRAHRRGAAVDRPGPDGAVPGWPGPRRPARPAAGRRPGQRVPGRRPGPRPGTVRENGRRNRAGYEDAGGAAGREAAFPRLRILTPAAAAASIAGLCAGLPVTDVFCFGDIGGLPDDLVDRHTQLAVRELAPLLAEEGEL